jgi:hypothetical protein
MHLRAIWAIARKGALDIWLNRSTLGGLFFPILSNIVLAILGTFTGQVALVILYALLGGFFSLALGLLLGAVLNTVSAASAVGGMVVLIYVLAGTFVLACDQLQPISNFAHPVHPKPQLIASSQAALFRVSCWTQEVFRICLSFKPVI